MAAPFIVPFNFQPDSTTIKTTSYTVPSGKYANITVYYEGTETQTATGANLTLNNRTITLNSSVIFIPPSYGFTIFDLSTVAGYTVTFPRTCRFSARGMGFSFQGVAVASSIVDVGGVSNNVTTDPSTQGSLSGIIFGDMGESRNFWAKSGDIISGSGNWRAMVTEYNMIS